MNKRECRTACTRQARAVPDRKSRNPFFGGIFLSQVREQSLRNLSCFRTFEFRTSLGTFVLLLISPDVLLCSIRTGKVGGSLLLNTTVKCSSHHFCIIIILFLSENVTGLVSQHTVIAVVFNTDFLRNQYTLYSVPYYPFAAASTAPV